MWAATTAWRDATAQRSRWLRWPLLELITMAVLILVFLLACAEPPTTKRVANKLTGISGGYHESVYTDYMFAADDGTVCHPTPGFYATTAIGERVSCQWRRD